MGDGENVQMTLLGVECMIVNSKYSVYEMLFHYGFCHVIVCAVNLPAGLIENYFLGLIENYFLGLIKNYCFKCLEKQ